MLLFLLIMPRHNSSGAFVQHVVECGHPARKWVVVAVVVVVVQRTLSGWDPTSCFDMKNILQLSLAWGQSTSATNKGTSEAKSTARSPPPPPRARCPPATRCPYLPPRCPRGAWARAWAASLLCCGAPSSEKQREHIRSRELPVVLGYCFTMLKNNTIFPPKKMCQVAVQGPSPAVSMIKGKLMRCRVLRSSRKEKGSVLHCTLNCIFLFKVHVLILHLWTR